MARKAQTLLRQKGESMILKQIKLKSNIDNIVTNCYIIKDEETNELMVIDPGGETNKIIDMIAIQSLPRYLKKRVDLKEKIIFDTYPQSHFS